MLNATPHSTVRPAPRRRRIRSSVLWIALSSCAACAITPQTQVRVAYVGSTPPEQVTVEAINASGHPLPMPPVGLIAQAAQFVTGTSTKDEEIIDVFAAAATSQLRDMHVHAAPESDQPVPRLRIELQDWDVHDATAATGAVVFVSAQYQLRDPQGAVLWEVTQQRLPLQLTGPTVTRLAVERIATACLERALVSFPRPPPEPTAERPTSKKPIAPAPRH